MMKAYINTKEYSYLCLHQPFNKRIWLMKRERTYSTAHHFSFGERFDERGMNAYCIGNKHIVSLNHQFIGFSPLNKFAGNATGGEHRHPQAGRTDFRSADRQKEAYVTGEKKKETNVCRHHR